MTHQLQTVEDCPPTLKVTFRVRRKPADKEVLVLAIGGQLGHAHRNDEDKGIWDGMSGALGSVF